MNTHTLKAFLALLLLSFGNQARATQIINAGPSLSVVQGDRARFSAQFFDRDGNSGVSIRATHVASGQQIGEISRNNSTGDLEWSCDTSSLQPGANQVRLIATDPAGASATVPFTIQVSAPTSVQSWRQAYFGSSQATGSALDNADPDGDGLSNLAEFAFGTNPQFRSSDIGNRVEADHANARMRAIMRRRSDYLTYGIEYIHEFSSDLQFWETSAVSPQILDDDGTMQTVTVEFPVLSNGSQSTFFRTRLP
ncbi:MAG TPA: hypothetical protein VGE39_20120 [Prosthecobacter sp.]